jgi:ferritin-like metal-binding protein YciE
MARETKQIAQMDGDAEVKDAALVAAQQKFEHNKIACYGTAVTFAKLLGDQQAADLLAKTLDEEDVADGECGRLS